MSDMTDTEAADGVVHDILYKLPQQVTAQDAETYVFNQVKEHITPARAKRIAEKVKEQLLKLLEKSAERFMRHGGDVSPPPVV